MLTCKLPRSQIRLERKKLPFTRPDLNGWHMEFPGSDRSVVQRTQYYNYQHFNEHPVQIQTYFTVASIVKVFGTILLGLVFSFLSMCNSGRQLLERYPEVFTFGVFSKSGPTRAQIDSTRFSIRLIGKGWIRQPGKTKEDDEVEPVVPFNKTLNVIVSGRDPGYMATSTCIVQCGLTLLKERLKMPKYVLFFIYKFYLNLFQF